MRLKDRVAVVTGAAGGIGKAIAKRLASEGAVVVVADLTQEPREGGGRTVDEIVAKAVGLGGRIDIMVNNAAIGTDTPLLDTSVADFDRVMAVNARGVFLGCRAAIARMITQEPLDPAGEVRGRVVNISSQHGMIRAPNDIAYGVGKAAVVYMTRQIAADYAPQGIVCNAVAPGKVLTGKTGRAIDPEMLDYSHSRTPWPRLGRPGDVANAVLFLASDECSYITGENLMVDGGWMAG